MFDLLATTTTATQHPQPGLLPAAIRPRSAPPHWFALMLDEIDYGMLLLADDSVVLHANHVARAELDAEHPLQLLGRRTARAPPAGRGAAARGARRRARNAACGGC